MEDLPTADRPPPPARLLKIGEQRCEQCATFMGRVGFGGLCPCCDEPVTVDELLDQAVIPVP